MNRQQMVKPAVIAGAVLVALVIAGLPVIYLGYLALFIVCPLAMYVMMRGGMDHGGGSQSQNRDQHDTHSRDDGPMMPGR